MTPQTWEQWAGALTAVGTAALGAWRYGDRIFGWCRGKWTQRRTAKRRAAEEAAKRAAEQAEALAAIKELKRAIRMKNAEIRELETSLSRKNEVIAAQDQRLARKDERIAHLEILLDGSRR